MKRYLALLLAMMLLLSACSTATPDNEATGDSTITSQPTDGTTVPGTDVPGTVHETQDGTTATTEGATATEGNTEPDGTQATQEAETTQPTIEATTPSTEAAKPTESESKPAETNPPETTAPPTTNPPETDPPETTAPPETDPPATEAPKDYTLTLNKSNTFFKKEKVIETQQGLLTAQAAAKEKIQQQKSEIAQYGTSKIHITEDERQLARLALKCQTSEKDIHVFSDVEIAQIKDGIQNGYRKTVKSRSGNDVSTALYIPKQGAFFIFMLNSGVRGGEAVSLKYSDFDFLAKTVKIQRNAVNTKARNKDGSATGKRSRKFTTPKTARSADILCLSDRAIAVIEEMKKQEPDGYDGFVVHSNYKPLAEKTLWQRFDKLLKGVGVQPCGLHSLRHTHGTKLYETTQDLKFVAQQLRHTDPSFTAKTYVHQTDKRTRELLEGVDI